jgi:hypothetical protein
MGWKDNTEGPGHKATAVVNEGINIMLRPLSHHRKLLQYPLSPQLSPLIIQMLRTDLSMEPHSTGTPHLST